MRVKYVEQRLNSGENIVYTTRPHWIVMLAGTLIAAVFGVTGVGLIGNRGFLRAVAIALSAAGILLYTVVFSKRAAVEIALTNKRLLLKEGLADYQFTEMFFSDINSILVVQSKLGRRLGFGTIIVGARDGNSEHLSNIENPLEFRRQLEQHIGSQIG